MDMTNLNKSYRLMLVTAIYFSFFIAEVSVGFYSHSLALVADAFHCVRLDQFNFIMPNMTCLGYQFTGRSRRSDV
ncbi:hypothetical protein GcM3_01489 [Golovinomyces cichoracearum]|uniref:Cation efflux protein transmembrane domain-containing protein n=1 Tax=Golovinomyces cichoracearum TaxID=62708 RepID=A0A420J980_9PEZI|nr:hypothetical protein GcM3_01489 [Golovinomyces cichoracearum]